MPGGSSAAYGPLRPGGDGVEASRGLEVEAVHEVAVTVDGDPDRRVSEPGLDHLGVLAGAISHAAWVWRRSWIRHGVPTVASTALRQILPKDPRRRNTPSSVVQTIPRIAGCRSRWPVSSSTTTCERVNRGIEVDQRIGYTNEHSTECAERHFQERLLLVRRH
jgi:hypothetical protein